MSEMNGTELTDTLEASPVFEGMDDNEKVSLSSLSELTGFPVDFIKKELLLDEEPVSMNELRASVLRYLEATSEDVYQS